MVMEYLWCIDEKKLDLGYVLKVEVHVWKFIYIQSV